MAADITVSEAGRGGCAAEVRVWDPFVRLFHWSLVLLFALAWATGDEWDRVHELAGYGIVALVALRLLWGLAGTRHARFTDFVYPPRAVVAFLKDTVRLRAKRYLGHNPAGGAMAIALLVMLAVISATGILLTGDAVPHEPMEELHEGAVNATLVLVGLHVLGVLVTSLEHGENLVRAMITGRKRAP